MERPLGFCTGLIILLTVVVSFLVFRKRELEEKYVFHPESILAWKQYYRLVTSAFLHADWQHLGWNMFSLYLFGSTVELFVGKAHFLLIYFGAVVGGNCLSLYVHRHHEYQAYGASGGVCGVIFAHILLLPGAGIGMLFIPFFIPAWLYAIGFILVSFHGMRTGRGNVGHDAHLGGAIVGLLITAALHPASARYQWPILLLILGLAVPLLVYLWVNPLFLPLSSFLPGSSRPKRQRSEPPAYVQEQLRVDAILEKVSKSGMESLSADEKALLEKVSGKYQRRAESKKPGSGLAI